MPSDPKVSLTIKFHLLEHGDVNTVCQSAADPLSYTQLKAVRSAALMGRSIPAENRLLITEEYTLATNIL